jgi:hypothetical protein
MVATTLAPWGGLSPLLAYPVAGWLAALALVAALVAALRVPPAFAGLGLAVATLLLGPLQPAPPDRAGVTLTAAAPRATLPATAVGRYVLDVSLANAAGVADGALVATASQGTVVVPIRAGMEAVEWAHERDDVNAAHRLPPHVTWRPAGVGREATWGVAARTVIETGGGAPPVVERATSLPPAASVFLAAAGPSRPTPPRDWELPVWLLAAALAVFVIQALAGTWRSAAGFWPWLPLVLGSAAARMTVEPLRLLLERHGPDLALAALVLAWLPAARVWLARRRVFVAGVALLVPLALATPHLTPPMYGDEPFHLVVLDSLASDHDLDLSNNFDLEHHPYNRIYITGNIFLHSPALAVLLLPGYLVAGRAGALALLAVAGAGLVTLVARRARQLGVGERRVALLAGFALLTYPLATFVTEVWVEVPGALAAAACLVLLATTPPRWVPAAAVAALATAVKTRLGLVTFPILVAAWLRRRLTWRELARVAGIVAVAVGAGLVVGWAFLGHPLGYRRLSHLIPWNLRQPPLTLGGLLFDPSGGLVFSAPLLIVGLLGAGSLWRRGAPAERGMVLSGVATVLALLSSHEWYGGGSPPGRYLVPLLPLAWLALAFWLALPRRGRVWAPLLVVPGFTAFWVLVTRPHFSINPGDGGYWLADAVARRFAADGRHMFPSFLRPSAATWMVPAVLTALALAALVAARRRPRLARALARQAVALWLVAAGGLVLVLHARFDRVVELEDPQVVTRGGAPEPPVGTFSRYTYTTGWRLGDGDALDVPLHLPPDAAVRLHGTVESAGGAPVTLRVAWDEYAAGSIALPPGASGSLLLPPPPGPGRHRLTLGATASAGGQAVLDRLTVQP